MTISTNGASAIVDDTNTCSPSSYTSLSGTKTITAAASEGYFYLAPSLSDATITITVSSSSTATATKAVAVLAQTATSAQLDTGFNSIGYLGVQPSSGGGFYLGYSGLIANDGSMYVVGNWNSGNDDIVIMRLHDDGTFDTTFATGGIYNFSLSTGTEFNGGLGLTRYGQLVMSGYSDLNGPYNATLTRFTTNGELDTTFGTNGTVFYSFGSGDTDFYDVEIQPDGKIVAVGDNYDGTSYNSTITRLNEDGTLDTSFNLTGKNIDVVNYSGNDYLSSVKIQPDGKIVAAGTTNSQALVTGFNSDGSFDTTFATNGIKTIVADSGSSAATEIKFSSGGKIVVFGSANPAFIARLNTDGSFDTTFNSTGKVNVSSGGPIRSTMVVLPDDRIVASVVGSVSGANVIVTHCYDAQGVLDTTFNSAHNGNTSLDASGVFSEKLSSGTSETIPVDLLIDPRGKIVTVGYYDGGALIMRQWP